MKNKKLTDSFKRAKVLITDDDKMILNVFSEIIERLGIKTETAQNFEQADYFIRHHSFQTILLDIRLGLDLLALSKKIQPDTPVIMITGASSIEIAIEAVRSGAYDYMCKPVKLKNLSNLIMHAVELKILREEKKRVEIENRIYLKGLEQRVAQQTRNLRESTARYRKLFKLSKDPMFILNSKGKFTFLNQATINFFAYSEVEILGMRLSDLYAHPGTANQLQQVLEKAGSITNFKVELLRKNGHRVSIILSLTTTRNTVGRIVEFQGIIRDITPNKRAADRMRKKKDLLISAMDSIPYPFLVVKVADFTVELANSASKIHDITGGHTCYALLYGLARPCLKTERHCVIEEVKRTKEPATAQFHIKDKGGNIRYKEACGFPVLDETGSVTKVIYYVLEVTERKKTRLKLQLLSTAVEQSADSILIADQKGIIQYVNLTFESTTGYSKDEAIGKHPIILNGGQNDSRFYKNLRDTVKMGKIWRGHIISKKKDGTLYEEDSSIYPVRDETGQIQNYVEVKRDATEKRRLESIVEAANLMDNVGFIFSSIRHEIGNPLNSAKMALTVLDKNLQTYSKETIDEFVKRTLEELARIEYLMKALKSFNMHERIETERLQVGDLINRFVTLVKNDYRKKGIRIRTNLPPESVWIYADYRALHHVFLNLLSNAAEAFQEQEDPEIFFNLIRSGDLAQINVSDNGKGMSTEELQNAFQPFYTSKLNGTGLGLVIVKKMLSKMNSNIKIESVKNKGTTVSIFIPEVRDVE